MENSFWYVDGVKKYPKLSSNVKVDACVIGGGLAGLMTAYELSTRGLKVCVVEASVVGSGDSGRSSAMLSYAHDAVYSRLIKKHGKEKASEYLRLNESGLEKIKKIISENALDCDYNDADMHLFSTTKKGKKQIHKEAKAYKTLGKDFEVTTNSELPYKVTANLKIGSQGYLNPFKFLHCLCGLIEKNGGIIYENTKPSEAPDGETLWIGDYSVKAKHFVVATHFPYIIMPGFYFAKIYRHRSRNIAFHTQFELKGIYESVEDNGYEYRPINGGILAGGNNERTGRYKKKGGFLPVEEHIKDKFGADERKIVSRFSAHDCMTFDMLPYAGNYGMLGSKNLFVITGFNKWGFTHSAVASDIISDLIEGKERENLYDTKRLYISKTPLKTVENVANLLAGFGSLVIDSDMKKVSRVKNGTGATVRINGKRIGLYREENGKIHAVSGVCPHMGCGLKWNQDELSWDCPCHGSRFGIHGNLLNNPALTGLKELNMSNNSDVF
ncbi:MAG: FAD-dependent oxidoreductase [Firmicutes bacterium]|nr:FAD-dependent oxidoreductase [Bacillota bacterium]